MIMRYKTGLLRQVREHIKKGGIIAYPTESCYGLGCNPYDYKAINKLIKLKQRKKDKGLIIVASKFKQLNNIIKPLSVKQIKQTTHYWPGSYSLILDAKPSISYNLKGKHTTVAVRVTQYKLVIQLCDFINSAVVSTSANKSKLKSIRTYRECIRQFGQSVLVLPGMVGNATKPSTIIDLKTNKVLRK